MIDIRALANQAAELEDQTETTTFTESAPPPVGLTVGRFVEYIDLGMQPRNPYLGKPKPPADTVLLVFELLAPRNIHEPVEGQEGSTRWADRIILKITKSTNEKAGFYKLFLAMTYGRADIKHMAQMLGEAFIMDISHNEGKGKDGKPGRIYPSIKNAAKEWTVRSPYLLDPITQVRTDVPVPPAITPLRAFVWKLASKETWDSLFIDGSREVKDASGETVVKSKNWIQETILGATNFPGSPVEQVVKGLVADLPLTEPVQNVATQPAAQAPAVVAPAVPTEQALVAPAAVAAPVAAPAVPDPRLVALIAAGLTLEQAQAALGAAPAFLATPAAPAAEAPKKGRGKAKAAPATAPAAEPATPAPAPAQPAAAPVAGTVAQGLAALGL